MLRGRAMNARVFSRVDRALARVRRRRPRGTRGSCRAPGRSAVPSFSKRAPALHSSHGERARWRAPSGERNRCELTSCRPRVPATPPCNTAMFRNQYDTDVTTWSPQGRLHQVTCPAPPLRAAVWTAMLTFAVRAAVAGRFAGRAAGSLRSVCRRCCGCNVVCGLACLGRSSS